MTKGTQIGEVRTATTTPRTLYISSPGGHVVMTHHPVGILLDEAIPTRTTNLPDSPPDHSKQRYRDSKYCDEREEDQSHGNTLALGTGGV